MKIYDISMEIKEDMAVYKDKAEKKPAIRQTRTLEQGSNEFRLEMDSHTGTHADSYFHMLPNGKRINEIILEKFIGNCTVVDLTKTKNNIITAKDFKDNKTAIKKDDIILLKTRTSKLSKFDYNFTYLHESGATYLASKKIKLVGIDNLGIERDQKNHETHKILFKKNIPIIEGLELADIKPGRYFFVGLPLKIKNCDASPIRAVLIEK